MSALSRKTLVGAVLVLGLAALWLSGGKPAAATTARPAEVTAVADYRVAGPFTHGNLSVFLLHGPDTLPPRPITTLDEALVRKTFVVHETGTVNTLCVENLSDTEDVLIQPGDMVEGGRQDRLIAVAVIVPPKSGRVAVPSFCVESGRWRQRGNEAAGSFAMNGYVAPGKDLKYAAQVQGNQQEVWANAAKFQEKASANVGKAVAQPASPTSLYLSLGDPAMVEQVRGYESALGGVVRGAKGAIGYVVAVNGKVTGAEVFGSSALLSKAWPKALRSAARDAVAEAKPGESASPPTAAGVLAFLTDAEKGEKGTEVATASAVTGLIRPMAGFDSREVNTYTGGTVVNGTLILSGTNTYTGDAIVRGGTADVIREVTDLLETRSGFANGELRVGVLASAPAMVNMVENQRRLSNQVDQIRATYANPTQQQQGQSRVGRQVVEGYPMQPSPLPQPGPVAEPAPIQPAPVTVTRVRGQNGAMVESRDASRPGVVIHRSFIAK